jgi:hypothetical protein
VDIGFFWRERTGTDRGVILDFWEWFGVFT